MEVVTISCLRVISHGDKLSSRVRDQSGDNISVLGAWRELVDSRLIRRCSGAALAVHLAPVPGVHLLAVHLAHQRLHGLVEAGVLFIAAVQDAVAARRAQVYQVYLRLASYQACAARHVLQHRQHLHTQEPSGFHTA